MSPIKPRFLLILLAMVLCSNAVYANDCLDFVRRSIQQQDTNLFNLCGNRGSRWVSSKKQLFQQCQGMSKRDRAKQLALREKALSSCATATVVDTKVIPTNLGRNRQQRLSLALLSAIRLQNETLVRSVLKAGVNVGMQPSWMEASPVFLAVELGNYHIARILVRAGAKPYLLASGEINPISLLLQDGPTNYGFLEFLLQNKANPNLTGKGVAAERPIVLAATKADFRSVDLLLKFKADANLFYEMSAIQKAVQHDHFPMVRALLKSGANPNLGMDGKLCAGRLALDDAYRRASERVINILLDNRGLTKRECKKATATQKRGRQSSKRKRYRNRKY